MRGPPWGKIPEPQIPEIICRNTEFWTVIKNKNEIHQLYHISKTSFCEFKFGVHCAIFRKRKTRIIHNEKKNRKNYS